MSFTRTRKRRRSSSKTKRRPQLYLNREMVSGQNEQNSSSTTKKSLVGKSVYTGYSDLKPREEGDLDEYYPDLDVEEPFSIVFERSDKDSEGEDKNEQHNDSSSSSRELDHYKQIIERVNKPSFRKISNSIKHKNDIIDDVVIPPKINKILPKLGFTDNIGYQGHNHYHRNTYLRSSNSKNGLIKNTLARDDKFQVLYDMDEQDYIFLKNLKSTLDEGNKCRVLLSFSIFEVIITFLEMQWYFTEKLLPAKIRDPTLEDEKAMMKASVYGSDDGIGAKPEEDQPCAVCNSSECDSSNSIIFCDGCNIAVHQECYGVAFIPEGSWLCRKCLISRDKHQRCLFCPSVTGAFKQLDNGYWGHVICALWINELYFANPIYMEPIEGFLNIPKSRWRLNCYICKKKIGACVQCCNKNCFLAYHVTCARRSDLYMNLNKGIQGGLNDKSTVVSYCHNHSPQKWKQLHDVEKGIEKTRLYYSTVMNSTGTNNIVDINDNKVKVSSRDYNTLKSTKNFLFKWRTKKGSIIVPEIFVSNLINFLKENHIIEDNEKSLNQARDIIYEICKYWTLKREFKNNIPLIKRIDTTLYGQFTDEEIMERLKVLNVLNQDLTKLIDLSNDTLTRSKLAYKSNENFLDVVNLICFPVGFLIKDNLERLMEKNKSLIKTDESSTDNEVDGGITSFMQIYHKAETLQYDTVSEFIEDFKKLELFTLQNYPHNSSSYKFFKTYWARLSKSYYKRLLKLEEDVLNGVSTNSILSDDNEDNNNNKEDEIHLDEFMQLIEPNYSNGNNTNGDM